MRVEEREVRMQNADGTVSEPSTYEIEVVESYAEAVEKYGESGAFSIFLAGEKVKQDNVARNAFRSGKSTSEVEALVAAWRPGGQRTSKKTVATQLMFDHVETISADPQLKSAIQKAFLGGDYDAIITELENL